MSVSKRINKIGESLSMKIAALAKEMQVQGDNVIDLSIGEPDFPTPQNVKDAAKSAIDNNQTHYTLNNGTIELRTAISQKLKRENGLDYSPNDIIVSAGAKQCLFNAIQSLVHDNDEVIIPAPYYVSYPEMVALANGVSVIISATEKNGFNLTPEQLEKAITPSTKILILSYPTNPTGACYSKKELVAIADIIEKKNLFVICDDIYEHLIYDDNKFISFASINENVKNRTVVVNGFSKTYAMTGWRIGYAAGPEEIIKAMNKVQSHSTSNASSISQAAALEALNGPQDFIEIMRKEYDQKREFIFKQINSVKGVTCFKPKGAFYIFPNFNSYLGKLSSNSKIETSYDLAMYLLSEVKVATVPGSAFGMEGYLRLSFSTSMENIQNGIERIKEALAKLN